MDAGKNMHSAVVGFTGVSSKCWLDPVVGEVFSSSISLLIFCLVALSIVERAVLKSLTTYLFCFTYFAAKMASEFIFMLVTASCWIDPLISITTLWQFSFFLSLLYLCWAKSMHHYIHSEQSKAMHGLLG